MEAINKLIDGMGYDVPSYIAGFLAGTVWTSMFAVASGVVVYLVAWFVTLSRRRRRRYLQRTPHRW